MIHLISQSNSHNLFDNIIKFAELSNISFGKIKCHKTRFANDEIAVTIDESVRNKTIAIIAQPIDYEDTFELLSTIDAAKRSSAKEIIAVIPSLPHSRQERRANGERTSISARLYADMLQAAGLDRLITVDLHTTAIEGFYKIPVDNLDPFDSLCWFLKGRIDSEIIKNPILVSPDLGGMKRVKRYSNELNLPMAFLNKERLKPNEVNDMTLIGDVSYKDVIIIDDMIDTGGTIIKSFDLLFESDANSVTVMATHGLFSNNGDQKLLDTQIKNVVVTNTLIQKDHDTDKFKVVDISSMIFNALVKLTY